MAATWTGWRRAIAETRWSVDLQRAAQACFDILERELGDKWPAYATRKYGIPPEFSRSSTHLFALARLLDLGFRLEQLRDVAGMGKVRRTL